MQNNSDLLDLLKASAPAKSGAGTSTTHLGSHAMAGVGGTRKVRRVHVRSFFCFERRGRKNWRTKKRLPFLFVFFVALFPTARTQRLNDTSHFLSFPRLAKLDIHA